MCGHRRTSLAASAPAGQGDERHDQERRARTRARRRDPRSRAGSSASGHAAIHEIAAGTGAICTSAREAPATASHATTKGHATASVARQRVALAVGAAARPPRTRSARPGRARSRAARRARGELGRRRALTRNQDARADVRRARRSRAMRGRTRRWWRCPFTKKLGVPVTPLSSALSRVACDARGVVVAAELALDARDVSRPSSLGVLEQIRSGAARPGARTADRASPRSAPACPLPRRPRPRAARAGARRAAAGGGRRSGCRRRTRRAARAAPARR